MEAAVSPPLSSKVVWRRTGCLSRVKHLLVTQAKWPGEQGKHSGKGCVCWWLRGVSGGSVGELRWGEVGFPEGRPFSQALENSGSIND